MNRDQIISVANELNLEQGDSLIISVKMGYNAKAERLNVIYERFNEHGLLIVSNPQDRSIVRVYEPSSIVSIEKKSKVVPK